MENPSHEVFYSRFSPIIGTNGQTALFGSSVLVVGLLGVGEEIGIFKEYDQ